MELLEELGILVKMMKVVTMEHCFQHFLNFTTVNKAKQHVVSYITVQTLCTAVTHPTSCAVDVHYINNMCHHLHKQHVTERQAHLPEFQSGHLSAGDRQPSLNASCNWVGKHLQ